MATTATINSETSRRYGAAGQSILEKWRHFAFVRPVFLLIQCQGKRVQSMGFHQCTALNVMLDIQSVSEHAPACFCCKVNDYSISHTTNVAIYEYNAHKCGF